MIVAAARLREPVPTRARSGQTKNGALPQKDHDPGRGC